IAPAGDRLYVVSQNSLCLIDAAAQKAIGSPLRPTAFAASSFQGNLAVRPDGATVYLTYVVPAGSLVAANSSVIVAVDATVLEKAARGLQTLQESDLLALPLDGDVNAMALSPDGRLLYVASSSNEKTTVVDPRSMTIVSSG